MSNEASSIKFSNPAPLGLAGFALTTWLLSMINVGWFSGDSFRMVLAVALAFGGTAQAIAGIMELPRNNTFGTTAFLSYGAFWWSLALFILLPGDNKVPEAFVGWYLFLWGVFSFYMWIGSLRAPRALQAIFFVLWITFVLLALGKWVSPAFGVAGGYGGLLTAALAFYLSAAEVINETHQRTVLPIGAPVAK
jgi:succinate-acetate transporter protein